MTDKNVCENSRDPLNAGKDTDEFIYVPSINIYVAKERSLYGKNWYQSHKELENKGERMLLIPEFIEFLKYLRANLDNNEYLRIYNEITGAKSLYNEITGAKSLLRSEWLNAKFEKKSGLVRNEFYVYCNGKSEEPLEKCLMEDRLPGIDLEEWINNPNARTKQGLPKQDIKAGSIYFWCPRNGSVSGFGASYSGKAYFNCGWDPETEVFSMGVRGARRTLPQKINKTCLNII